MPQIVFAYVIIIWSAFMPLRSDGNGDRIVDQADMDVWRANIGKTGVPGDYNSDGKIDLRDWFVWRSDRGKTAQEVTVNTRSYQTVASDSVYTTPYEGVTLDFHPKKFVSIFYHENEETVFFMDALVYNERIIKRKIQEGTEANAYHFLIDSTSHRLLEEVIIAESEVGGTRYYDWLGLPIELHPVPQPA